MSRHIEQGGVFEAILKGGIRVAHKQPIEILVSRVPVAGLMHISRVPFWAYTAELVDRICGPDGVRLRGGAILPWDSLTHTGGLVVVRLFPCEDDPRLKAVLKNLPYPPGTRPIVDLNSLLRKTP